MPLKDFFEKQFQMLEEFMITPDQVVRCVRIDPEFKDLFIKALVRMEEDPENPHLMIPCDVPFDNIDPYFDGLFNCISENYQQHASELEAQGVQFKVPFDESEKLSPGEKFVRYVSTLSDSLPDSVGSLVFILDPQEIKEKEEFKKAIEFLAVNTQSMWVKYLVLDQRVDPILSGIEERTDRVGYQTFYMSPENIEQQTKEDLKNPSSVSPLERRQYIGLLAGFAFARKEYDEAEKLQKEWVKLAESEGTPSEAACAYYNLGNTLLAKEDLLSAEDCFCKSIKLCLENKNNGLLPMVLTNLGITFHRQKRIPEAIQSFQVARDTFKALNLPPGEAYVLDSLATIFQAEGKNQEAEASWLEALSIYNGVTSDTFTDVREGGIRDIKDKLEKLYQSTGEQHKTEELRDIMKVKESV